MIISSEKKGPLRVVLEAQGGALALFSPAHANRAKKMALQRGGEYWVYVWMMRRFSKYAMFLGHRNSRKWNNRKRRQLGVEPVPFYGLTPPGGGPAAPGRSQINGAKMKDAVRNAKVSAVGIAGREAITIRVPYGHPIRTEDSIAFKRLPLREITLIAKEVGIHLARTISTARLIASKRTTSKAPRLALSVTPRATATRAPRKVG